MRRSVVALALVIGCGQPQPSGAIDASDDGDSGVDAGNDSGNEAGIDAPGTVTDAAIDGPPAMLCPTGTWCTETAPVAATTRLFAVHARDSSDVWAVGDGGVILRRRNDTWTVVPSGTTSNLRGIWAASANDAWAVGANATVLRWNGTAWGAVTGVLAIDYSGVWGSSASDVWLIGTSRVQRWNGSSWAAPTQIPGTLMGIHGTGPNDVWVAGETTYLRHYTGTWTVVMPMGSGSTNFAVEAIATNNVWTVAPGVGTLNHTGGAASSWTTHASDAFVDLHAFAADDIWGVAQTKAGHWNGSSWTSATPPGVTLSLWGVSGAGGHLWVVGSGAKILHRN